MTSCTLYKRGVWSKSRLPAFAFSLAIVVLVVYFVARGDDASRSRQTIDRIGRAIAYDERRESLGERNARLTREIEALVEVDAVASIPEAAGVLSDRAAITRFATDVGSLQRLDLSISDVVVSFDASEQTAQLKTRLTLDIWRSGYETHEVRNATVRLVRRDAGWRIASVTVAARTHEEPEARP
jgi:hypothetical protein